MSSTTTTSDENNNEAAFEKEEEEEEGSYFSGSGNDDVNEEEGSYYSRDDETAEEEEGSLVLGSVGEEEEEEEEAQEEGSDVNLDGSTGEEREAENIPEWKKRVIAMQSKNKQHHSEEEARSSLPSSEKSIIESKSENSETAGASAAAAAAGQSKQHQPEAAVTAAEELQHQQQLSSLIAAARSELELFLETVWEPPQHPPGDSPLARREYHKHFEKARWDKPKDYTVIMRYVREFPEIASEKFGPKKDANLLSELILSKAPFGIIKEFCDVLYPDAVTAATTQGPCRLFTGIIPVRLVGGGLGAGFRGRYINQRRAQQQQREDYLPLHHAIRCRLNVDTIEYLISKSNLNVLSEKRGSTGDLPLHCVVDALSSEMISVNSCRVFNECEATFLPKLKLIASQYPEAILQRNHLGQTPLLMLAAAVAKAHADDNDSSDDEDSIQEGGGEKYDPGITNAGLDMLLQLLPQQQFTLNFLNDEYTRTGKIINNLLERLAVLNSSNSSHHDKTMNLTVTKGSVYPDFLNAIFSSPIIKVVTLKDCMIDTAYCRCCLSKSRKNDIRPHATNTWDECQIEKLVLDMTKVPMTKNSLGWFLEGVLTFPNLKELEMHLITTTKLQISGALIPVVTDFITRVLQGENQQQQQRQCLEYLYLCGSEKGWVPTKNIVDLFNNNPQITTIVKYVDPWEGTTYTGQRQQEKEPHFDISYASGLNFYRRGGGGGLDGGDDYAAAKHPSCGSLVKRIVELQHDGRIANSAKFPILYQLLSETPMVWTS